MSGVRIYDPELRALGMTLPGFVERGKVIASMPSLGLLTLAGLTPAHWEVEYHEIDAMEPEWEPARPGLVAISFLPARAHDAYAVADRLRTAGNTVVLGGLHVSAVPEEAESHADAIIIGQGEPVWRELLADYESGSLQRCYGSTPGREFEPWAVPAFHLLDPAKYNRIPLQTTRGCPLDCSFCAASRLISPYKRKPLELIDAELEAIEAIWPKPFIELADDNTFVHKAWAKDLVRLLARHKIRWFTETDISVADDPELLGLLAESGCAQLLIGFESLSEDALSETDSKSWKRRRRDRYLEAIETIQSHGISVNGCFAFGFDHDTPRAFEQTLDFVRESRLSEVQVTILTPFPGTALTARLRQEGRLLQQDYWEQCTLFDVTFRPKCMSADELRSGFRNLVGDLYSEAETLRRKAIFRNCLRHAKGVLA